MISNTIMKALSAILFVSIVAVLGWEAKKQVDQGDFELFTDSLVGDSVRNDDGTPTQSPVKPEPRSRLAVGVMGATPTMSEVPTIDRLPWLESEINLSYRDAESNACRLLLPELPVSPSLALLAPQSSGVLGRVPALTVGLELDPTSKKKLPSITIGKIESYFRDHRLAIEPTIYQAETGELYFGTECRAAFYEIRRPDLTTKPEPMVEEAINRFRAFGVLGGELANDRRTLVLAFRYVKADQRFSQSATASSDETEFLFLHLQPESVAKNIEITVFVSSDNRQKLHRLSVPANILKSAAPMISATIRFDSSVLLGYYPANPVVTDVDHRSDAEIRLESLRFIISDDGNGQPRSFEQILDDFDDLARDRD